MSVKGMCISPKTVTNESFPIKWDALSNDGLLAVADTQYISIWTGPEFGCVNFEAKENKI